MTENKRHGVFVDRWGPPGDRRVIVVVMPRLSGGSARGLQSNGLVVAESAAAFPALDDGYKSLSVLLVEKRVQDRVDARVRGSKPLSQWCHDRKHLFLPFLDRSSQFYPCKDQVQWKPGKNKQDHNSNQHFDDFDLGFLLHTFHLGILGIGGDRPSPDLDPN